MSLVRLPPRVQRIQAWSLYIDIHTNALVSPLCFRPLGQHVALAVSHTHPESERRENPGSWGARHINDTAPFNLWDEQNRKYRSPKGDEMLWIRNKFGDGNLGISGWYVWIETTSPPQPIPHTVGCMPVIFVGIGERFCEPIPPLDLSNPRVPDPCPALHRPAMTSPTTEQNVGVLTALEPIANVRAVIYMPHWTILELEYGDSRIYEPKSLPGIVAGRAALYHHAEEPFYKSMKDMTTVERS